jgi:hypothetical protein
MQPIPLSGMEVRDPSGSRGTCIVSVVFIWLILPWPDDLVFEVAVVFPRGGDTLALRCSSVRECHLWVQTMDKAIKRSQEAESRARRGSRGSRA